VGGDGVAFGCHIKALSKSAGHSGPLSGNGYLRPAPHHIPDFICRTAFP
jgi:hypothetical protein